MKVSIDPQEFQALLTAIAKEELKKSGIRSRTGSLLNSVKVEVGGTEDQPEYILSFNNYGLFLDAGVQGQLGGKSGAGYDGTLYKFDGKANLTVPKTPKPGSGFGIAPRPWVANALDAITKAAAEGFETQLSAEIEKSIAQTIENIL